MAPRTGCFLLPLLFIASSRVILVHADCADTPADPCIITAGNLCKDCVTPGGPVPNPKDCASFYYCLSETDMIEEPFSCPDGQIFDVALLECIPDDGSCTPSCTGGGGGDGGKCFYTCDGATEDVIADPFDCSVYQECTSSELGPAQTCPADTPYFNGKQCVADESDCCHCRPYCYSYDQNKRIEDPTDCRKFFLCLEVNKEPTFQGTCSEGEHFSMHTRQCSSTAPCVTLCRNVVDGDGCIDPYTCQEIGYFPICKTQCLREYYHCVEVSDDYATPERCPNNLVFNPDTLTCIKNETCPYNYK